MLSTSNPTLPGPDGGVAGDRRTWSLPAWWTWGMGLLLGLVVVGPGLSGGSLLSLDLLVTPDIPVPNGMYGLGPALSQRVPLFAVLGLGSALVGGPVITKVLIVAFLATGFAGGARLVRVLAPAGIPIGVAGQVAAGLLWAVGPYALTRVAVGHINLLWVVAILPWVLPRLCRPADHLPSTYLAALALAIGGPGGGTLGVAAAAIALVVQPRPRRFLRPALAIVVPQLVWLLPTAVLLWAGAGVSGANEFPTRADGPGGLAAVVAGNGFWRADYQVGATGAVGVVAGLVVAVLAAIGGVRIVRDRGWGSWQGAATVVAASGLALALASAVPGVRAGYEVLTELPFGAPLRESQRFSALWLVWASPAVVIGAVALAQGAAARRPGARRVATAAAAVVPLVVALAVSVPGWWGLDGRLEPVDYPADWATVRDVIDDRPGTVVALPWAEYPSLRFADYRQAFNPLPDYLGGDVISSYDPLFEQDGDHQEQVDRRSVVVDHLVDEVEAGRPIAAALADLGVRWVVLAHEPGAEAYGALEDDLGLDHLVKLPGADLYEVRGWKGAATGPDGAAHDLRRPVPPVLRTDAPAGSVLNVAGAPGWVQGWGRPVAVTDDGRLRLEGSGGTVWFWPSIVILVTDVALAGLGIRCLASRRARFGRILAPGGSRG
ncbi:hypothetical protein ACE2AJ_07165 [Aquihabitans daechungensis]|uniref:hypothetical protein n=1 Tax=Aquihabitans daechungensis TaxID=1052257 RepID=UPI003BA0D6D4